MDLLLKPSPYLLRNFLLPTILLILSLAGLTAVCETTPLLIQVGQIQKIPFQGSTIWVEKGKIIKVRAEGSTASILGIKEGSSLLDLGTKSYLVQVAHPRNTHPSKRLEKIVHETLGLEIQNIEGKLQIHGRLYHLRDWLRIAQLAKGTGMTYEMYPKIFPEVRREADHFFNLMFQKNGLSKQNILYGLPFELKIADKNVLNSYTRLLSPYGINVLLDSESVITAPTVKVQVLIAEVKKDLSRKLGIQPPSSYTAQVIDRRLVGENLSLTAKAFEAAGEGRVLANPDLICRSGKEAEFMAGGEFPIKISTFRNSQVLWKQYGILLKIKPQADPSGRMSVALNTEISSIDSSKTIDDIPGLFTNRVSSHFDLLSPQTIVLSGLIKSEEASSHEGLPWLSSIPILGALFSSQDFRNNKTELLILVRPAILEQEAENLHASSL